MQFGGVAVIDSDLRRIEGLNQPLNQVEHFSFLVLTDQPLELRFEKLHKIGEKNALSYYQIEQTLRRKAEAKVAKMKNPGWRIGGWRVTVRMGARTIW